MQPAASTPETATAALPADGSEDGQQQAGDAAGQAVAQDNSHADEATPLLSTPATDAMETEGLRNDGSGAAAARPALSPEEEQYMARHTKLKGILTGFTPIGLHLEFLYSHNHADLQVVKNIKNAVEVRHWPPEFVTLDEAGQLPEFCWNEQCE